MYAAGGCGSFRREDPLLKMPQIYSSPLCGIAAALIEPYYDNTEERIIMPFINAKFSTTVTPDKEYELKAALGEAITLLGKSERYLMVEIEDNRDRG